MALFVIGDLHLSLGSSKPMDVFGGWENYVERLETNWKKRICEQDVVVLNGDLSWGMNLEESREDFAFLQSLPGTKILIKGNHDYWWSTVGKMQRFFDDNGFTSLKILHNNCYAYGERGICGTRGWIQEPDEPADIKVNLREAGRLDTSILCALKQGLKPLVFLHYPPVYGTNRNEEILAVMEKYGITECFYGHIHGKGFKNAVNGVRDGVFYQLVSSDFMKFNPLDLSEFVQSTNL